jgi:sodium/proline symporter
MSRAQAILLTLLTYNAAIVAIGVWAARRTHDDSDFFLGGRRLGSWVAALSASASSSSAWTLLGVSGAAYAWGISALWLFPATVSGFVINWVWVAPRLMRMSRDTRALTLTAFIAGAAGGALRPAIVRLASVAILFSFLFYVASQFQAAGHAFAASFGLSATTAIAVGVAIIVLYTLLGGFWAVSVTDTLQGLVMAAAAVFLPLAALVHVGGFGALAEGLTAAAGETGMHPTRGFTGVLGLAFVLGTLGIGLGYPGQPHVVNRFMALRDEGAMARGRIIAIAWAVVIYSGMLLLGLCARVTWDAVPDGEQVFFHAANAILPAAVSGIMIAAVLSAIMSTADSQLLVASSAVALDLPSASHDPGVESSARRGLLAPRLVVLAISAVAMGLAIGAPATIFARVLFAWSALGSAFGPVLVVRLAGYDIDGRAVFASIAAGFGLTIIFHLLPDQPGDWLERLGPLAVAAGIAVSGARRATASGARVADTLNTPRRSDDSGSAPHG